VGGDSPSGGSGHPFDPQHVETTVESFKTGLPGGPQMHAVLVSKQVQGGPLVVTLLQAEESVPASGALTWSGVRKLQLQ